MTNLNFTRSFSQFLQSSDCLIAKILCRLARKNYHSLMITDSEINYLTFRNDGTISYLPAGKEHLVNDDGTWKRDGRQNGKPAKVIKKLFHPRVWKYFKDADFECFTNQYKATFNDEGYKFQLLDNKKIPSVYDMELAPGEGSLSGSCMNNDSEYMDIYKNCSSLQILILTNGEGKLCGRSLIWKINDEITLMDRIYTTQDFMFDKFLQYAVENNLWRKRDYKSYNHKTTFINPQGEEIYDKHFKVITDTEFDSYPYIDTFCYGDEGFLSNYEDYQYTYNCTNGERSGDEHEHEGERYDDFTDEWISEDEAVYIEYGERRYRNRTCHIDNAVCINDNWYYENDNTIVQVGDTWYTKDDDNICEIDDEYHLIEDCTFCERDDCYYLSDDCVYCEEDDEDVLMSEAVEIDGNWYHKDSDKIVEINGKYYLESTGVTI